MINCAVFTIWTLLITQVNALSILTIENHNADEHIENGGWGEWSEWHTCSRTCGGGVTYMQRKCRKGRSENGISSTCEGPKRMYSSCSIQDCPVNSEDFRAQQCTKYNNKTYNGRRYDWIPYVEDHPINPCELHCQPKSRKFHVKLAERVVDGTRCQTRGLDVCVGGKCETVGCDMLLGSHLKLDVCGECDGDGSSCSLVRRSITAKLPPGYVPFITIPPGATNIVVQERRSTKNHLAVRDSGKRYVLNGQWQLSKFSRIIPVAGSDLVYTRKSDRRRSSSRIEISGPITEMVYMDVLIQERNRGIDYEFYLPRGTADPNAGEHEWSAGNWQRCSADCGQGIQRRRVVCKNRRSNEKVPNYLCDAKHRPTSSTRCNSHPCKASWMVGDWKDCTQICGSGLQIRQVICIENREETNSSVILLPERSCTGTKPEIQRTCGLNECSEWTVGNWSSCSSSCGRGVQSRQVECPQNNCEENSKPRNEQPCNDRPCVGIDWVVSDWSQCIGGCDEGVKTREVICATEERIRYPERLCDASRRPASIQNCGSETLCPDKPVWVSEEWSECSVTCGHGIQTRRVICALYETRNYRALPDDICSRGGTVAKPSTAQDCLLRNCSNSWYTGSWGPCSVSCQGGIKTRAVLCVAYEADIASDDMCDRANRPGDSEPCNEQKCDYQGPDSYPSQKDCHHSTYGCCPDGITLASGPFQALCDLPPCTETRFGCCPDGVNRATGDHYEGCANSPDSPTQSPSQTLESSTTNLPDNSPNSFHTCSFNADPGNCTDWTVHWFFDFQGRKCDRFWFGGCGGNPNRFDSLQICSQVCGKYLSHNNEAGPISSRTTAPSTKSQSSSTATTETTRIETSTEKIILERDPNSLPAHSDDFDILTEIPAIQTPAEKSKPTLPPALCFLRKSAGLCQSKHHRWYFDGTTGTCLSFWYGGCGGNENNFASEKNCLHTCGNKPLPMFERGLGAENTPPIPVHIKPGREEVYAQKGKMARLACMAVGSPKPTVVWKKIDRNLPLEAKRMETLEDNSLLISKITSSDAGSYECIASNGHGPDQKWTVKLIVKDRVLIRETPSNTTINVGEPAAMRCRIHDDVFFVTWYKDGRKVPSNEYYNMQPWGDLHILHAKVEDSGVYTCTAYATNAQQSASATLTVSPKEQTSTPTTAPRSSVAATTTQTNMRNIDRRCRDYPEYANCNVVVSRNMCNKHNFARYCCISCGGSRRRYIKK